MKQSKIQKDISEMFNYHIQQKHCRTGNPKMRIAAMCKTCRDSYYQKDILIKIRDEAVKKVSEYRVYGKNDSQ